MELHPATPVVVEGALYSFVYYSIVRCGIVWYSVV